MKVVKTPKIKYSKLRNFVKGQGMTYKEFAENVLHTSATNIDYKWRGVHDFTIEQVKTIRTYFNLTNKQVIDYFFDE
jgi:hypothetical protein